VPAVPSLTLSRSRPCRDWVDVPLVLL